MFNTKNQALLLGCYFSLLFLFAVTFISSWYMFGLAVFDLMCALICWAWWDFLREESK